MEVGGVLIQNPTRGIVFGVAKVMVTRFVCPARVPATRERPQLDCGFTVHAQPLDPGGRLTGLVFF